MTWIGLCCVLTWGSLGVYPDSFLCIVPIVMTQASLYLKALVTSPTTLSLAHSPFRRSCRTFLLKISRSGDAMYLEARANMSVIAFSFHIEHYTMLVRAARTCGHSCLMPWTGCIRSRMPSLWEPAPNLSFCGAVLPVQVEIKGLDALLRMASGDIFYSVAHCHPS